MIAAPVGFDGFGHFKEDAHARETGILGGEALVDGVVIEQGMKLNFWRERPAVDNAHGKALSRKRWQRFIASFLAQRCGMVFSGSHCGGIPRLCGSNWGSIRWLQA